MLMFGSVLILIGIYYLYQISSINGWQNIDLIAFKNHPISFSNQLILFPFLFIGFSVFTAMFPFIVGCQMGILLPLLRDLCFWQAFL